MSRLCRLRNAEHGDDGQWAYNEIVSLRRELKNMTDQYNAALEAEQVRYRQVVEKDAEIERLKGMVDEIQAARHMHREHNRLLTNLASSQAREQQLRAHLEVITGNRMSADNCLGNVEIAELAIALPQDTTALESMITKAAKESNDRLNEEREIWDRMFADGAKKLERLERELDDCLYVLDALWDKKQDKSVTQKWADILIRNKRATGASSAEDTCHPTTE